MYDGKQVLRFVNNYKIKDLYLIGNEMNKRIGTGNYDSERTKFNVHYKNINKSNLYPEVKSILENKNIEYSHKTKTNILNGVTFTSGPEFFMTLGLPFKESNRTYQSGDKKGQNILVPDIKSKDDIPSEVTKYFECCMKFSEDLVGKENIVMAQIHKALMNFDTKWYDINFVKVPDPKTCKPYTITSPKTSSNYRTIPIPNFLLKDLSDLYNDDANYYGFRDSWYVFGNIDPLAATTLLDRKTKNAFMARVKDIRIHDFRHSCASLLIDSGANITLVAKYLGHSKIDETLNTYSHMYQNRLDTIVNIIELQNSKLNNNVIETNPTILLEHKETTPELEEESYDYEEYKIVKPKNKDDLVL